MRTFTALILLLLSANVHGTTSYFTVAGMAQEYPEEPVEYGLSVRSHTIFYDDASGWFFDFNVPGQSIFYGELGAGYSWRFGSGLVWEFGGGGVYGAVPGPGIMVLAAAEYSVTGSFSLYFPFYFRSGGLGGLEFAPYLGWRF